MGNEKGLLSESLRDFAVGVVFAMIGGRWLLCGMKMDAPLGRGERVCVQSQRDVPAVQG